MARLNDIGIHEDKLEHTFKRFLAVTGIIILFLIATSDGDWFPWANFGALGVLFVIARWWAAP